MRDVMIDCETLGTFADAVIMSIGAVKFDLVTGDIDDAGFYASISIDSNLFLGRQPTESTILWWMEQNAQAKTVFTEPKMTLEAALVGLTDWLEHNKRCAWSNGADFDLPMIAHAYRQHQMEVPWEFWNSRCVRTYKSLPAAASVPKIKNDHNALRDAYNQVKLVQSIYQAMTRKVTA